MNVFYLDSDPRQAARDCFDKHVWKMHTESIQLLVSLLNNLGIDHNIPKKDGDIHKGGYPHHPNCKWLEESIDNVHWLLDHCDELIEEHHRRKDRHDDPVFSRLQFDKFVHDYLDQVEAVLPHVGLTPPYQAMPDHCRDDDPVAAYRSYYIQEKHSIAEWCYCDPPEWYSEAFDYAGVA